VCVYYHYNQTCFSGSWIMVFNVTFNNISAISWWSVLLVSHNTSYCIIEVVTKAHWGQSWSYGSWIYNYLCNQCLSPLTLLVRIPLRRGVLDITLCDDACQWLATGIWFSPRVSRFDELAKPSIISGKKYRFKVKENRL
jgi:hypothetical protein